MGGMMPPMYPPQPAPAPIIYPPAPPPAAPAPAPAPAKPPEPPKEPPKLIVPPPVPPPQPTPPGKKPEEEEQKPTEKKKSKNRKPASDSESSGSEDERPPSRPRSRASPHSPKPQVRIQEPYERVLAPPGDRPIMFRRPSRDGPAMAEPAQRRYTDDARPAQNASASAPPRRPGYTPAQPRPAVRPILLPEDYGSYANSPYTPYEPAQPRLPTPPDITYEELPPPSQDSVFYNSSVPHSHELLRPDASPSSPVSDFVPQSRAITGFPLVYEAEPVYGMQGETEADLDAIFQALDSDFAKFDHAYEKAQEPAAKADEANFWVDAYGHPPTWYPTTYHDLPGTPLQIDETSQSASGPSLLSEEEIEAILQHSARFRPGDSTSSTPIDEDEGTTRRIDRFQLTPSRDDWEAGQLLSRCRSTQELREEQVALAWSTDEMPSMSRQDDRAWQTRFS